MPSEKKTRRRKKLSRSKSIGRQKPLLTSAFGSPRCHPARTVGRSRPPRNCIPAEKLGAMGAASDKAALSNASVEERRSLLTTYFRPDKPDSWDGDPDMWLDNTNIDSVLRQYQAAYPWFKFIGVLPIDFAVKDPYIDTSSPRCIIPEMCSLDLQKEAAAGIKAIGIIYNLDPHFKGGSHWVANFIDLRQKTPKIYYFDSYGEPAPKYVRLFMEEMWKRAPSDAKPLLAYNARRFQYGDSECGMYSTYFIIAMLQGVPFKQFVRHPVPDREMIRLRDVLFFDSNKLEK